MTPSENLKIYKSGEKVERTIELFPDNLKPFEVISWLRPKRDVGMAGAIYSRPDVQEMRETANALQVNWTPELFAQVAASMDSVVAELNKRQSSQ